MCVCVCVTWLQGYRRLNYKELATEQARYQRWLLKHECKAFYTPVFAEDLKQGAQYLLQVGRRGPWGWGVGGDTRFLRLF